MKGKLYDDADLLFTREHNTIEAVKRMNPSYRILEVLYYAAFDGHYFLLVLNVPQKLLNGLWSTMPESTRARCVAGLVETTKGTGPSDFLPTLRHRRQTSLRVLPQPRL